MVLCTLDLKVIITDDQEKLFKFFVNVERFISTTPLDGGGEST